MTARQKRLAAVLAATAFALVPSGSSADPIILNPNFSLGNAGFTTGYAHVSPATLPSARALWPEGTYTVGNNPSDYHELWQSFGDHTTGDGGMLIFNGNVETDVVVWSTTVVVTPGTQYEFSAWLASTFPASPASLAFNINGIPLNSPFVLSSTPGFWQEFNAGWYSGAQTTARLSVTDLNTVASGNDFALDDINFRQVRQPNPPGLDLPDERDSQSDPGLETASVPDSASTVFLLGLGLTGLAGLARRWN
jgi:hypothetical protein